MNINIARSQVAHHTQDDPNQTVFRDSRTRLEVVVRRRDPSEIKGKQGNRYLNIYTPLSAELCGQSRFLRRYIFHAHKYYTVCVCVWERRVGADASRNRMELNTAEHSLLCLANPDHPILFPLSYVQVVWTWTTFQGKKGISPSQVWRGDIAFVVGCTCLHSQVKQDILQVV